MNCLEFRDNYSDFADGLLDELAEVRFHAHLARCDACRRFDDAFRRGLGALRRLTPPPPSGDFDDRLHQRLAALERQPAESREPESRILAGVAGTVLVLAVVGALGWEARTWIAPKGPQPPIARNPGRSGGPFGLRFAGDRAVDYRSRFSVIPALDDSSHRANRQPQTYEITVDWMAP